MAYRPPVRYLALLAAALALAVSASLMASAGASVAVLKAVGSRIDGRTSILTIEASDPVPYIASQPDPNTLVVELRDVVATGYADRFKTDPRSSMTGVRVETQREPDGAAVTRVSLSLRDPLRPRVRSSRNLIFVEADRAEALATVPGAAAAPRTASSVRAVKVTRQGSATAVTLSGDGRLMANPVQETVQGPPRLYFDVPGVAPAVPSITAGQGPVERVRVGINSSTPLVTRVVMDLTRAAAYRVERSPDGRDVTVIFDDAADPVAALSLPSSRRPATAQTAAQAPAAAPQEPTLRLAQAAPPAAPPQGQAPAPVLQPPPQPTAATPTQTRFTGMPISLDFQAADLRAVLRTFADISGLNLVIDPAVMGTVDVALRDVPWDQALEIILRANRLGYVVDGNIMRVAPVTVLADEEAQRQKLAEAQALAGALEVRTAKLSYAKAEDVRPLLLSTVLSARGTVQTDPRTNTLIISDLPERLDRAVALLETLDAPQPQVEIDARIVQTTRDFARAIGVKWGIGAVASPTLGNTLPFAFPNNGSVEGNVNLPNVGAPNSINLALGALNGAINLDVALTAAERDGQVKILSNPKVTTQNNVPAEMTQGTQIPIQTVANNTVTVTFKDAALTLRVTPQITAAGTVIMDVALENAVADFGRQVNGIPPINTQRAATKLLVSDNETSVIGGVFLSTESTTQDRTPGLYRLPLLGWLFKRDDFREQGSELLIFITPRIVKL